MNDILQFLQQRNSAPKLEAPGPEREHMSAIYATAVRAPDHAWLRPWRFIEVRGERRNALGDVFAEALVARNPGADEAARDKARNAPLRAPVVVAVVTRLSDHPKVPHSEQRLSSACAAHGILLAAEAQGFAGIWRTGDAAFDPGVAAALGLSDNEEIAGFIYLGTRAGRPKTLPEVDAGSLVHHW